MIVVAHLLNYANNTTKTLFYQDRDVGFDVETAIRVCRQAGYYQHALYLADKHAQHEWYLKIQLEDIKDYQKALHYIGKLQFHQVRHRLSHFVTILPTV